MNDDELRAEIVALRNRLADLERRLHTPDTPSGPERTSHRVSRRGLLAAAVAGGAGLVATQVSTAAPAAAAPGDNVVLGAINNGDTTITTISARPGLNCSPFNVVNPDQSGTGIGLAARLGSATGRFDGSRYQRAAVVAESDQQTGVTGMSNNGPGVYGESVVNAGVRGTCDAGTGVRGSSVSGSGVYGESTEHHGVYGFSGSPNSYGVKGQNDGGVGGVGVHGECHDGTGVEGVTTSGIGLIGSSATGTGLQATTAGAGTAVVARSASGTGVNAQGGGSAPAVDASSASGYGVQAKGARAPLRLVPSTKVTGRPTTGTHQAGELFVDKTGVLYFCTVAGTPGTWKKVALQ